MAPLGKWDRAKFGSNLPWPILVIILILVTELASIISLFAVIATPLSNSFHSRVIILRTVQRNEQAAQGLESFKSLFYGYIYMSFISCCMPAVFSLYGILTRARWAWGLIIAHFISPLVLVTLLPPLIPILEFYHFIPILACIAFSCLAIFILFPTSQAYLSVDPTLPILPAVSLCIGLIIQLAMLSTPALLRDNFLSKFGTILYESRIKLQRELR